MSVPYKSFEDYKNAHPYKYTKVFSEQEWNEHLESLWKTIEGAQDNRKTREYIIVTKDGRKLPVEATNTIWAKIIAIRYYLIPHDNIKEVL